MTKRDIAIFLILVFLSSILPNQIGAVEGPFFYSDGALIKGIHPEVFLIKFQKRHWIKSPEVFSQLGFKWQDIIELQDEELHQYSLGSVITSISDLNELKEEAAPQLRGEPRPEDSGQEPVIKIGIYGTQNKELFQITANGPYEIYKNNQFLNIKNKGEIFETIINHQIAFKFIPKTKDTVFEINKYRLKGNIELQYSPKSKLVWVINELNMEDYLKGVAEVVDTHPLETLKSLVVAARSYALFHFQNGGKYPEEIFHLRNWAYDQFYEGYSFESRAPNMVKAIEETEGMVATYFNQPIRGVYSFDSGGITKDACLAWGDVFCGKEYNYLRGEIKDPPGTEHNSINIRTSHAVGISAAGAEELAKLGKNYQEILKYYYQGIEIEKLY